MTGFARIETSSAPGVTSGISELVTTGVTGVAGGLIIGDELIEPGVIVPGFSDVQPVKRIARMRSIPGSRINRFMITDLSGIEKVFFPVAIKGGILTMHRALLCYLNMWEHVGLGYI